MSVSHFDIIYKQPEVCLLGEIMILINEYPHLVEEYENEEIFQEVSLDEFISFMNTFQKDMSLGPDV
jgi:hypothetical protein